MNCVLLSYLLCFCFLTANFTLTLSSTTFSCGTETKIIPKNDEDERTESTTITPNSKSLAVIWSGEVPYISNTFGVYGQIFDPITLATLKSRFIISEEDVEEHYPMGIFSRTFYDSGEGEEVDHIIFVYTLGDVLGGNKGIHQKVYKWHNNILTHLPSYSGEVYQTNKLESGSSSTPTQQFLSPSSIDPRDSRYYLTWNDGSESSSDIYFLAVDYLQIASNPVWDGLDKLVSGAV